MFEDQLQAVQELLETDEEFRDLHRQHQELKDKIAELTSLHYVDYSLERMKKEKLLLKDRMANILQQRGESRARA